MSSFFRRLFGRTKIDTVRPRDVRLPAAPDPEDLFDWSPRARPDGERPKPVVLEEGPDDKEGSDDKHRSASNMPATAPISEALSQFQRPGLESLSTRPPSVPVRGPSAPPSMPSPPPPPSKPAQIRLLMGDGTVVEVSGDPELQQWISYLAENLLAPRPELAELAPPSVPPPTLAEEIQAAKAAATAVMSADIREAVPEADEEPADERAAVAGSRSWPQMRLVFMDGSEATLPPDQEIVDRLAYVIANLLPARPRT